MEVRDYEIIESKLIPTMGSYKYSAKMQFVYVNEGDESKDIKLDLGESFGVEPGEARTKMERKYNAWLEKQK